MKQKIIIHFLSLITLMLFTTIRLQAQITLVYDEFGITTYPKKCSDTINISYVKNYPGCKMKLFLKDCSGAALFELYDKKGSLKIKGEFSSGKDTLSKYSFAQIIGITDGKSHTRVTLIKYLYPQPVVQDVPKGTLN